MLLFAIEIVLTVLAWRKGWRGWALMPLGILIFVAFFIGVVGTLSGFNEQQLQQGAAAPLAIMELATLGVLIGLATKRRNASAAETALQLQAATESASAKRSSL